MSGYDQIMQDYYGDPTTGILRGKGTFAGQHWTTVAFFDMTMESMQDDTLYAADGTIYDVFYMKDDIRAEFGIPEEIYAAVIHKDGDGNPYAEWMTPDEFSFFEEELLAEEGLDYE